ncbi:glycosyltransferase family 22 protein [Phanerochaete carnosa HHB-10118-sp]|uniref:Mannosyltransferase n=1 Tax=Phanerochaete carnosa (strain HHB-10118-sp) TaxID=650164 RepID=K5WQ87_PHACS|nr:glycosyltransferase family 22 protein [Phanerochaete carnosa HHB-10118-sp]EKM61384.1 glycosyltransferase family 22 protein [Phanerochaete carnosa HHB-10118-sp]
MATNLVGVPGAQTIRFRRPVNRQQTEGSSAPEVKKMKNRHSGLLQDQLRRAQKAPWTPSMSVVFRVFLLVRVMGAMYVNLNDCDEVFNFWEPLHYLSRGHGFQTWETSPMYSIRSWAYILLHYLPTRIPLYMYGPEKRPAFFAVRLILALLSSLCEAFLYRRIADYVNYRVARYFLFTTILSAGMWNASVSFLPSSFAMYTTAVGFGFFLDHANKSNFRRTMLATLSFAAGAIVGWPFAAAIAIPFVFEELYLYGTDQVAPRERLFWRITRWKRMIACVAVAALLFIPVVALDTLFYGELTAVPWNIIKYNVFPEGERGPDLYGTESVYYYFHNLLLNLNVVVPFALASLPALAITHRIEYKRLGDRAGPESSSHYTEMAVRLAPMYLWFAIMSAQPHKEERFLYPVYPLIYFNAAVTIYLARGWMEVAYVKITKSPYRASIAVIFSRFTLSVVTASMVISVSRLLAQWSYYHAPQTVMYHFDQYEIPSILNRTGYVHLPPPPKDGRYRIPEKEEDEPRVDYDLIYPFNLTLCVGKEWHRFPGHYYVPDGVRVEWIKSEFDGMLPGHFKPTPRWGGLMARLEGTHNVPVGLNDLNKEEPSFYVDVSTCDYLMDLDFPLHPVSTSLEPRYAIDNDTWERAYCQKFLDTRHSPLLTRALWMPGSRWQEMNEYGDYCLLKHRANMERKENALNVRKD